MLYQLDIYTVNIMIMLKMTSNLNNSTHDYLSPTIKKFINYFSNNNSFAISCNNFLNEDNHSMYYVYTELINVCQLNYFSKICYLTTDEYFFKVVNKDTFKYNYLCKKISDINKTTQIFDFIVSDIELDDCNFFCLVVSILEVQKMGGSCVIKLKNYDTKFSVQTIFMLCSSYFQVYMCYPESALTYTNDVFIVCKKKMCNHNLKKMITTKNILLTNSLSVDSIIKNNIPIELFNKLSLINIINFKKKNNCNRKKSFSDKEISKWLSINNLI